MANPFDQFDVASKAGNPFDRFDAKLEPQKPPEAGFSATDVGISGVRGVLGVSKAITDVFGADNPVSQKLADYSSSMAKFYTPERQKEIEYYEKKAREAEAAGKPVEEIKVALESIKAAPLQATAEAVGSIVPNLASLFIPVVGEARGAALARSAYNMFIGILEGTGAVKGSIYDNVKAELVKNKVPEAEAARIASEAQSYTGKNFDQILLGAGIGAATGKFGVESLLSPKSTKLAQKAAAVGSEMFTEAGQASQEQIAANLAARREGLDVDLMSGVAGAATREGVMGALGAGTIGAISRGAPEAEVAPPTPPAERRGSDILRDQIGILERQPQTPETQATLNELRTQLDSVVGEETKIDNYKQEFSSLPDDQRRITLQNLQQEQLQREQLLSSPESIQQYAESQNIPVEEAQQQLQTLYQEGLLMERAYSEVLESQEPTTVEFVSDIRELTPEQKNSMLEQAIEPIRTAVSEGNIKLDDAIRIVNKSVNDEVLQATGFDLLQNRDAELVENMLEVLRRESPTKETIADLLNNTDFMEELERVAEQSVTEQRELNQDITNLEEGDLRAAEKYGIDAENEAQMADMIATLQMQLDELRNLSQNEAVYERLRDEVAEARTAEQKRDKEKEKEQEDFTNVPDDILEKLDAHAFGQKLGAEYKKVGQADYFKQPSKNLDMLRAARASDLNGIADQLANSANPAVKLIAEKMRDLSTGVTVGFPRYMRHKKWAGYFQPNENKVYLRQKYAQQEHTVAHEFVHALTSYAIDNPTPEQKPTIDKLNKLYQHVKKELGANKRIYGLTNLDEFIAEANSNVNFQYQLAKIKYKNETAWGAFTKMISKLLGIANVSALTEVIALTEELTSKQATTIPMGMPGRVLPSKAPAQKKLDAKTPEFRKWFGNSKVVDKNGDPRVVYHGTVSDFDTFLPDSHFGTALAANQRARSWSAQNGKRPMQIMPVYLRIENPLRVMDNEASDEAALLNAIKRGKYPELDLGIANRDGAYAAAKAAGYDGLVYQNKVEDRGKLSYVAFDPNQVKSVFNLRPTEDARILASKIPQAPQRTKVGDSVMNTLNQMNRDVKPPPPGYKERINSIYKDVTQNPQLTADSAKAATKRFLDKMETVVFSSDAALNNAIRRNIMATTAGMDVKVGQLLEVSLSQTVHADALASLHMMEGKIVYDKELHKWVAKSTDANLKTLAQQVDKIAEKYGLTKEEAMLVAHTAFEAKRLRSLERDNAAIESQVAIIRREARQLTSQARAAEKAGNTDKAENKAAQAEKKRAEARKLLAKKKIVHMTPTEINAGMDFFKSMPELNGLVDTWQKMRNNTADVLVESGLWSRDEADFLLDNIDYVPFYREEQIEQGKGPKEFIRGLQVQARDPKFKGSQRRVNDIFDNMARWMQYAVNRSVRNRSALSLIDAAVDNGLGKKVSKPVRGGNNVNVWRDGKQEFYEMDDPLYVDAFRGLESVAIPALNFFTKMSNLLRQSVVMYPLFSVAQVPQDSFAAMFSSGLKPQFAMRIPVLAVKEFIKTLAKRSQTHEALRKAGAVGVKDFSAAVARLDAEMLAGLKAPAGVKGKIKEALTHIAMSADNAVRQAVYEASKQAGLSQAEALEKAFQVINFRTRGSSKLLALAGQVVPFFNAYIAAQHVAYKTITGVGTSPQERNAALKTLAGTMGSVMTLSLIYAMMNADDDDYKNKPAAVRDRLLMIPGTGMSIPLRMDLFTFPKVLTEHMYLLMTDKGYEDSRKFRDSMKNALANALFSPTPVPQAIKPLVEVGINYDFFQGRPLIGTFQKGLETERQFNNSTSELGKWFGSTGMISPIAADHLIRGMFGSVGGLVIYMTNPILHNDPSVERPSLSLRDAAATLPGTSGFVTKEYETALKSDFYVLRDEVAKVANTINDMKNRSPQDIDKYLEKPGVEERMSLQNTVNQITEELTKIRNNISVITNSSDMTAAEKRDAIREMREIERDLLESVNVKELREMAKI